MECFEWVLVAHRNFEQGLSLDQFPSVCVSAPSGSRLKDGRTDMYLGKVDLSVPQIAAGRSGKVGIRLVEIRRCQQTVPVNDAESIVRFRVSLIINDDPLADFADPYWQWARCRRTNSDARSYHILARL